MPSDGEAGAQDLAAALDAAPRIEPSACATMAEVRAGVDALDDAIVALLARRFRFMDAAARIKPERGQVRDEPRKAAVIAHARTVATREGAPVELVASLYEQLVEASIDYELDRFDARDEQSPGTDDQRSFGSG